MRRALGWLCLLAAATACSPDGGRAPEGDEGDPKASAPIGHAEPEPEPEPAPAPEQDAPRAACGDAEACFTRGAAAERAGSLADAVQAFEAACGLGLGAACGRLGEMYRDGRGVPADDRRARSLFEQGCALGSSLACDAVGH